MTTLITDGLVLRHSDYRDYDRMVTLLTPEHGRIDAAAYGCRRGKSQLINAAEVFCAGEYVIRRKDGRATIEQCRIHQNFYALREDLDKLGTGAYMLHQLMLAAQPETNQAEIFYLALNALSHLCFSDLPAPLITFMFEGHFQNALGQSPRMDGCVICGREDGAQWFFDAALGGCVCPDCETGQPEMSEGCRRILLKAPRAAFQTVSYLLDRPEWREAAVLMRKFTAFRTDPEPKSWPSLGEHHEF